jgi:HB1, ASXL, restriction endonuclease HTH domain
MIRSALADARAELTALDDRRIELVALISQAEAALGEAHPPAGTIVTTLHEALAQILRENGNAPMTARALADAVTDRGLYRKKDGSPVEINQIHARTNNYHDLFEKDGPLIRLREESPMLTNHPPSVTVFREDDEGFGAWLDDHPDGYFINSERSPKPTYLVLHRPRCRHFTRNPSLNWTRDYIKICSPARRDLEEWATSVVGGETTLCNACFS